MTLVPVCRYTGPFTEIKNQIKIKLQNTQHKGNKIKKNPSNKTNIKIKDKRVKSLKKVENKTIKKRLRNTYWKRKNILKKSLNKDLNKLQTLNNSFDSSIIFV